MKSRIVSWRYAWVALLLVFAMGMVQCKKEETPVQEGKQAAEEKQAAAAAPGEEGKAPVETGKEEGAGKAEGSTEPVKKDPVAAMFPEGKCLLQDNEFLKFIPADAMIVMAAADVPGLLDRLGRPALVKKFAQYYEMAVAAVTQEVGHNILEPANFEKIGIDPRTPLGFAVVKANPFAVLVLTKITNQDLLKTTMYALAGKENEELEPYVEGDALVICPRHDEEVCVILRGGYAILMAGSHSDEQGLALAKRLAVLDPSASIASDKTFADSVAKLSFGKDIAGYMNFAAFISAVTSQESSYSAQSLASTRENLENAKKSGDQAQIEYWEQRVKEDTEWEAKQREQQQQEAKVMEQIASGLSGFSFGMDLTDKGVLLKSYMGLDAESWMSTVLRPLPGGLVLFKALDERPLYAVQAAVDLPGYLNVVTDMVKASGELPENWEDLIKKEIGFGVKDEILPAFSGEIGVALTGEIPDDVSKQEEIFNAMGGAVLLGVGDEAKLLPLLDKIAELKDIQPFVKKLDKGKYEITVPMWKTVHVAIAGKYFVASTDPEFGARVASGAEGKYLPSARQEVRDMLSLPSSAGGALIDFGVLGYFVVLGSSFRYGDYEPPAAEPGEVPFSQEYLDVKKELDALARQVKEKREEIENEQTRVGIKMVERIGVVAAVSQQVEGAVVGLGGYFPNAESLPKFVEGMVDDVVAMYKLDERRHEEVWKMEDKKWELQRKLDEIRARDVEKHYQQPSGEPAAGTTGEQPANPPSDTPKIEVIE